MSSLFRMSMLLAVACSPPALSPPVDAAADAVALDARPDAPSPDAAVDPFAGRFDSFDDFPFTSVCTVGTVATLPHAYWPRLDLRTADDDGELATFLGLEYVEERVPHLRTADQLLVRQAIDNLDGSATLRAFRICHVRPDGAVHGQVVYCFAEPSAPTTCIGPTQFTAAKPFVPPPDEPPARGLTLVGELAGAPRWPGITLGVAVDGELAYLARGADGLRIVSVADPAAPVERGHLAGAGADLYGDAVFLAAAGRRYVVAASNPTRVIDVTNPAAPVRVADLPAAHGLFLEGTRLYLAPGVAGEVSVYELADPRVPVRLGAYAGPPGAPLTISHVHVDGRVAYLSGDVDGLFVVDFRVPAAPQLVGREDVDDRFWHASSLARIDGHPYLVHADTGLGPLTATTGLRMLDADAASPGFLANRGQWTSRLETSIHTVTVQGPRAFVTHHRDGVRVVDLSVPTAPTTVGHFNPWTPAGMTAATYEGTLALAVDPARARVYLADTVRGLLVLTGDETIFP